MANESADSYLGITGLGSFLAAFGVLPAYFALGLLPHAVPSSGGWFLFFLYVLSIPLVLCVQVALFAWGSASIAIARLRGRPIRPIYRLLIAVPTVGFLAFFSAVALGRILPIPLPSGSYRMEFDSSAWQSEGAAAFNEADVTPRQMMLGRLLDRLDSRLTRADLDKLLGPPDPPGFPHGAAGSDFHYPTGPQRDSLFGLDFEWLLIYLDDSGHFLRYQIYVD